MSLNEPTTINSGSMKPQEHPRVSRKPKRRGKRGDIHIYKPLGSTTYWINFSAPGKGRKRSNTGKQTEADARIFAAEVGRMVGLANSDDLDDQRRLLEIARELLGGLPALEHEAAHITATKNLPTVRECFTRELTAMSHNTTGDDRHLKADSITRVADVVNDFVIFLSEQSVNLADAPLNRIGSEHVRGFLDDLKKKGYSGKTRLFARDRIRAMLGHAVDKGLLPVNPASVKQIGRLKFDTSSIRKGFNEKQISAIFNAAAKSPEKWLSRTARLALFTGQRAGDICAMQWDNIKDFDGLLPTITITQIKTGVTVVIPIATPLHRLLKAIPRAERTGYIIDEQVAAGYAGKYRNIFNRPWRALLNGLDLAG